ncbi:MAG: ATP-binding cassette domain-containing protein [Nitriliruptorales bacterium]|nr:ATP-binding cassette domain-containing protein [Nitriliruptorales bacterium]
MILLDRVTVTYAGSPRPALRDVDLTIPEGELCLVVGRTGIGKSTLLGTLNGLVPHFTGGTLSGRVEVAGRDTRDHPPRDLADAVGFVGQDPAAGFVTDVVEEELAYGMEQLGLDPDVMRKRVEETLDLVGLVDLRDRPLADLSAGEQQRVAIGAALTPHPSILVLDEPTSALDPGAAEDVLAVLTRLVHDLGITVVLAEHRLERVVQYADRVIAVERDGTVTAGRPEDVMADSDVAPPIVELGRLRNWEPLPLSVRDARRRAHELRDQLRETEPPRDGRHPGDPVLSARGVIVTYGSAIAVAGVDVTLHAGEVTALMGRNGSGKSSLLWALQGTGPRAAGTVEVGGVDPAAAPAEQQRELVGLVPHSPVDLLYLETVEEECAAADADNAVADGTCRGHLERLVGGVRPDAHPRDLSEGERLALALAIQLTASPQVVLLDEPTRGLDYPGKEQLTATLRSLAADGHAVMLATHDVEFVAAVADRVVVLAEGEVVSDGPTGDVVLSSPVFAPQVAKIVRPLPWLTVPEVAAALEPPLAVGR